MPDLGYPHQSPEQQRIVGIDTRDLEMTDYDLAVKEIVEGLDQKKQRLCRHKWIYRDTIPVIANKEKLTVDGVKWRLDAIREYVARHAGL